MRNLIVSTLIAGAALIAASPASARELPAAERAEISSIVEQSHPAERCGGTASISWSHDLQANAPELAARGATILGYAYGMIDGSCSVAIRSDLAPDLACTVGLHEREHLAGVGHDTGDPLMGDVEGDFGDYRDPRCAALVEITRDDVIGVMWGRVSARTKVACTRTSSSTFTCVSSRRLVRKTWLVRGLPGGRISARVVAAVA
jgi:hypothetical protein